MYLRILKKDLKRKKTMNIILLLFVVISSMFAASSVNNIISVLNGLDNYFDKAGMSDYFYIMNDMTSADNLEDCLKKEKSVKGYRREKISYIASDNIKKNGKKLADFSNMGLIMSVDNAQLNYFDNDDNVINEIGRGKAYLTGATFRRSGIKVGDKFQVEFNDNKIELEYAGAAKDAFLGGDMMDNPRIILNDKDYKTLCTDKNGKDSWTSAAFYVDTDDTDALIAATSDIQGIMFDGDKSLIKTTYIMNMLVAGLLLVVSVCLILVSFVVLRFTIGFTVAEEFREIGVMKAVGLKNSSIRILYLIKYVGIALVGSAIGFFASVPFGNMMLKSVSESMVLGNDNSVAIGLLCCLAVVGIILMFCWGCTRKIKQMSPIDAVRNGQTGERFHKKSIMHLGKSRLGTTGFLAVNDVISSPKQYGIMAFIFTICIIFIIILANIANTLKSDKLLFLLGTTKSDVYISESARTTDVVSGKKSIDESNKEVEKILADNNMSGKVHKEFLYKLPVKFKGVKKLIQFQQCKDTKADEYVYSKGVAPKYDTEIALTSIAAENLGVNIGDTVTMTVNGKDKEYIVTALFQSFNNLGESGRLHESVNIADTDISGAFSYQIDFDDRPDDKEINKRIEKLKDIFGTKQIYDASGFVNDCTGASETVNSVKLLVIIISVIIAAMISVLMERSFINKEKPEIALVKALGFKSGTVMAWHTLRFAVTALIAWLISVFAGGPLTKVVADSILSMMGVTDGIEYKMEPFEVFTVYPLIILATVVMGAFCTSLYTFVIKASDTSGIE